MRTISDTINRLAAIKQQASTTSPQSTRLSPLPVFGTNPGSLKAYQYVPPGGARDGAALVVVLHGCGQSAAGYDQGSGWSYLAEEQGFVVLYPEQTKKNNPNGCFNWFAPLHNRRDSGEALSIRQMVKQMLDDHPGIDPARIFVTGLSAGGAMSAVMLATYPDLFAGGAVIAGLPFGTADTIPQAFDRMRGHGFPERQDLETLVREASGHKGRWPVLSVWHGSADTTVVPANAEAVVSQWLGLHDLPAIPSRTEQVGGHQRRLWLDANGKEVVEQYEIRNMGHGTPLDAASGNNEVAGAYMLHVGISSTRHIAAFWGIATSAQDRRPIRAPVTSPGQLVPAPRPARDFHHSSRPAPTAPAGSIRSTIETALRKAGLMP